MTTSPTSRCPRCGHGSVRVALNLRVCQDDGCLTVFLVKPMTWTLPNGSRVKFGEERRLTSRRTRSNVMP
jgi:hypothetical protein